ncbi:hypothetical protein F5141DRAFT_1209314 [Pisolithus sp. B1]|nr:hypothetical protein F5141DRAFT_1209314 [Pisolithus sp. B1]
MPLDPVPPPSPHGNNPSPKHHCATSSPCIIQLSDVGRHYHSFPKGTFQAHFTPPILPKLVLHHFAAHPPTWTWTTKDGPSKGKSFKVPTIPIACDCSAPWVVQWIIMVFHSFKAHLNPVTLDPQSGRVLPRWLCLYQNNFYVHLQSQLRTGSMPTQAPTTTPKPPQPTQPLIPSTTANPLSELQEELQLLHEKFYQFMSSHEACCGRCSGSPTNSSKSDSGGDDSSSHSPIPPLPFTLMDNSPEGAVPVSDPPSWLVAVLQHPDTLEDFTGELYSPGPPENQLHPRTLTAIKLVFSGSPPFYLGIAGDKSLHVSAMADCALVATTLKLPPDPSIPLVHF